ncbi:FRIGIDA-like protein [Hordeum vulgare]|nr:FRIGIDA-like protein [Hordeum vulgare]
MSPQTQSSPSSMLSSTTGSKLMSIGPLQEFYELLLAGGCLTCVKGTYREAIGVILPFELQEAFSLADILIYIVDKVVCNRKKQEIEVGCDLVGLMLPIIFRTFYMSQMLVASHLATQSLSPGNVLYNELGVDLSEFKKGMLTLLDPDILHIRQLKHWLTTSFGLDPEVCFVSVHALWTKSCKNVKWELMSIDRSQHWLSLLSRSRDRRIHPYALVQPVAKEENFVQVNVEYEPGKGSHVSGSQPPDVDASQAEKESNYVPHNETGQSI